MKTSGAPASSGASPLRCLGTVAVCILLAATLLACAGGPDSAAEEQMLELEAKPESTEGGPWGQPLRKPEGAPLNLG